MIQTQVCIRPANAADADALHAFLAGLSPSAQYQRFFTGLGSVSPSLVRDLIAVTPRQQVVLAFQGAVVVGHAMATTNGAGMVELGVVVADRHRGRGIGNGMIRALLARAVLAGADRLRLDVLCENQLVLDWIRRGLPDTVFERDGYSLTGYAPLRLEQSPHSKCRTGVFGLDGLVVPTPRGDSSCDKPPPDAAATAPRSPRLPSR